MVARGICLVHIVSLVRNPHIISAGALDSILGTWHNMLYV
jgi:hypothetical protein